MGDMSGTLTIGVMLDFAVEHDIGILQGVQEQVRRQSCRRLLVLSCMQDALLGDLLRQGKIDGLIGAFVSDRWLRGLPGRRIPMVNVADISAITTVVSVVTDNAAAGRLAARHLLEAGSRHFAAVVEPASEAGRLRGVGFAAAVGAAGHEVFRPPPAESYAADAAWSSWLAGLPRPCGVFCSSDFLARRLLARVVALPARVPEDFALVGVGDSALDSLLAGVPLTSVRLPGRRIGERAAFRLAAMLEGRCESWPLTECLAPAGLAVRASSALTSHHDPLVARALGLIRQSLAAPPGVADLARRCGASRRTLETRFRRAFGRGPAAEARRLRIEHACLLLEETRLSPAEVAEACGFRAPAHFSAVFRRATGLPPGAWRAARGAAAPPGRA
jgi:LacI family transcriptional regulator